MVNMNAAHSRRQWLAAGGLLLAQAHGLAAPPAAQAQGGTRKSPLVFAVITPRGADAAVASWSSFIQRIAQELGQPITLRTWESPDSSALASAFASGEIDLAWVGNSTALAVVERGVGEVFAQMVTDTGSTGYHAIIVTHKDSGLKTLDAAQQPGKGLIFADGETKSFSGHLVPLYYAFVKRGINDPASLFREVRRGSHVENLTLAAQRKVDIATANDEELAMFKAKNPALAGQLSILWTSPLIPQSPLVWSTALPLDLRRRLQHIVTSFGKDNALDGQILKQVNNLSAFRKSRNSQLITAGDIDMFVAWQQVNRSKDLSDADKAQRIRAISERASRLELRLKLPPSVS
ncbi:phosphonate ABC transporter substrate-binding protein [Acidovorax sp. Leaf76]|uniref:phosphate/phosphite/phosphonate ABC transporter substrate-binding protein n=1 Tax=unclassified Acidovorax TaxID=2684926 RepID=UPI0006FF4461|nr:MULTISPECIES: phosphate/phosphite/phosphonate ABC transporter substrate-binding protein [unclassified Acidovorax]KQO14970.1 phosphonate ABC transporter substrate-binding protein [Acidovorax sp. Leaf76]KQO31780.1 phosphonate ABC transporter substrate-binding protein [Acidovorax sp. Leaf84]KQS28841.1 phosphonate ABC transporter substrate-binding protein [Acidovorax sp. Leaf191]